MTQPDAGHEPVAPPAGPWQRRVLVYFLAMIIIVPIWQVGGQLAGRKPVQELDLFRGLPTLERLTAWERALENDSLVAEAVRQPLQWLGLVALRAGNQKTVVGVGGTLFYRPSLDAALKPGFMDATEREGHPLPAITAFHRELSQQGVRLVVLAVPGKEAIYPEWLARDYPAAVGPAVNPDLDDFAAALQARGIELVDPTHLLWSHKHLGPLYLRHDTHWTPLGLRLVADAVAHHLGWPVPTRRAYRLEDQSVAAPGDLFEMLKLPPLPTPLKPEQVTVQRVLDRETGLPVEPDQEAPVVLLGDSFTNIYSVPEMGWGDYAGLAEQLSYRLNQPVDVIAMNDGGVNRTRVALARRQQPLRDKQVVVWQFAARDLVVSNGQWEIIGLRKGEETTP